MIILIQQVLLNSSVLKLSFYQLRCWRIRLKGSPFCVTMLNRIFLEIRSYLYSKTVFAIFSVGSDDFQNFTSFWRLFLIYGRQKRLNLLRVEICIFLCCWMIVLAHFNFSSADPLTIYWDVCLPCFGRGLCLCATATCTWHFWSQVYAERAVKIGYVHHVCVSQQTQSDANWRQQLEHFENHNSVIQLSKISSS